MLKKSDSFVKFRESGMLAGLISIKKVKGNHYAAHFHLWTLILILPRASLFKALIINQNQFFLKHPIKNALVTL